MLRIAPIDRSGGSTNNIKSDLSIGQLSGIGAVVIAWNEVEFMLDVALYSGESLPADCLQEDIPKRYLDVKIKQVEKAANLWGLPTSFLQTIGRSVKAFGDLKDLRNAVVHSRLYDAERGIGQRVTRKGEIYEVLLSEASLEWLFQQLVFLRQEMRCLIAIFDLVRTTEIAVQRGLVQRGQIDPMPEVESWLAELVKNCQGRFDLGLPPEFSA